MEVLYIHGSTSRYTQFLETFRTVAEGFTKTMREGLVPRDIFELAVRERDAYRKARPIAK